MRLVNKRIFQGKNLLLDQVSLQNKIRSLENEYTDSNDNDYHWLEWEGTCCPEFLHLEDLRTGPIDIKQIRNHEGDIVMDDQALEALHNFYQDLYGVKDSCSKSQMKTFLDNLDVPQIETSVDGSWITVEEVVNAISKLKTGKALGSDGIMAKFYKAFSVELSPLLSQVFNAAKEKGQLSFSQTLVIIFCCIKREIPLILEITNPSL